VLGGGQNLRVLRSQFSDGGKPISVCSDHSLLLPPSWWY